MVFYTTHSIYTGYVLIKLREAMGFKQQRMFAKFLNMSHTGLGKIERGETGTTVEHLYLMASLIGTTPDEILKCVNLVIEASSKVYENIVVLGSTEFNKFQIDMNKGQFHLDHNELDAILGTDVQIEILKIVKVKINEKTIEDLEQKLQEQEKEKQPLIKVEFSEKEKEAFKNTKNEILENIPTPTVATVAALAVLGGPIGLGVAAVGTGLSLLLSKRDKKAP
ncbi:helix-turn-helix transcriptional regulator [uncultured Acinetobacter sp.]|uniref:helix-turn-helix domain-containing protein n=1 Tax=uncultured Acinetobacter sp. TaxID=165433 RepID=UPI0026273A5D|nr:helix-turn-helix transcriptional regulator [uncultured Acinetobacter sp.]